MGAGFAGTSGVAPDLEYTAVLLQPLLRRIWHILIFAKILHDSRVLVSLLRFHRQVFFAVLINRTISEI